MRKVLMLMILGLCACKKEDASTPHRSFYGKWVYTAAINKQYTVSQGDTTYDRIDTLHYNGADYIEFTQNRLALRFNSTTHRTDSLLFEEVTPVFFHLDSLLCQATYISDSALQYNSLDFRYDQSPLVKISQTFYWLKK
jgi:hypothetical protein